MKDLEMSLNSIMMLSAIIFSILNFSECLKELNPVEDNDIITTEIKIDDLIVKILNALHVPTDINKKSEQYLTIRKKLLFITLQEYENLRYVVELPPSYNTTSWNVSLDSIVSETLSKIDKYTTANLIIDVILTKLVKDFLVELNYIKESYSKDDIVQAFIENKLILKRNKSQLITAETGDKTEYNRRVYKGKKAKIKYFPFLVSIHILHKFYCAGSIISSDLIITAASCLHEAWNEKLIRENPSFLTVRVGSTSPTSGGVIVSVKDVYFHPNFDNQNLKDNLCLVRLTRQMKLTNKKIPVGKVDFDGRKNSLSKKNGGITIIGWGNKHHNNQTAKKHPSYAKLKLTSLKKCSTLYPEKIIKKQRSICAKASSKIGGACEHDVGDPGLVNGILTGIVSFGSASCGHVNTPTVFTKLGYYSRWIEELIQQKLTEDETITEITTENQPINETTTEEITVTEEASQEEPVEETTKNILLREINGSSVSQVLQMNKLPNNNQPPPIYIADGVKSILYNNEYNIYFVTEKPIGRQRIDSSKSESSKSSDSEEISSTEIFIHTNASTIADDSNDSFNRPREQTTLEDSKRKKMKRTTKIRTTTDNIKAPVSPVLLPNALTQWQVMKQNNQTFSDMLKQRNRNKTNSNLQHQKYFENYPGIVNPAMKNAEVVKILKDFKHFLKYSSTSSVTPENYNTVAEDDDKFKSHGTDTTVKTTVRYFKLKHQNHKGPESNYFLSNSKNFGKTNKILYSTPRHHYNETHQFQKNKTWKHQLQNPLNPKRINKKRKMTTRTENRNQISKKPVTRLGPVDSVEAQNYKSITRKYQTVNFENFENINEAVNHEIVPKAFYDYNKNKDVAYDENQYYNSELYNEYLLNTGNDAFEDSYDYYELHSLDTPPTTPHTNYTEIPEVNIRTYRKSNVNLDVIQGSPNSEISNHNNESNFNEDSSLSEDYIYKLIGKTVDEIEKELQRNDSLSKI